MPRLGRWLGCRSSFNNAEQLLFCAASAAGWGAFNVEGGGLQSLPACFPALGNAASDSLGRCLPDATDLLFSAQELSRQRRGVFQPGCCCAQYTQLAETGCINSLFSKLALAAVEEMKYFIWKILIHVCCECRSGKHAVIYHSAFNNLAQGPFPPARQTRA